MRLGKLPRLRCIFLVDYFGSRVASWMAYGWCCLLSYRGLNVMPSRIDVCFCISELQRTSSLGRYCCEPWPGFPCLRSSRYARAVSIVQRLLQHGRCRSQPLVGIGMRGGGDALSGGRGAAFREKSGICNTRQMSALRGSPARHRLLAGGVSMSAPKRGFSCERARRLVVELSGVLRLRPRGCVPTEHKVMMDG